MVYILLQIDFINQYSRYCRRFCLFLICSKKNNLHFFKTNVIYTASYLIKLSDILKYCSKSVITIMYRFFIINEL